MAQVAKKQFESSILLEFEKKKKQAATKKKRGGAGKSSPGGRFPRSPFAEVGHRRPFFRRHVVVLLCGCDVAAPRGRLRSSGARESPLFWGGCYNQDISKIQKSVTTTLAYYIIRIPQPRGTRTFLLTPCLDTTPHSVTRPSIDRLGRGSWIEETTTH